MPDIDNVAYTYSPKQILLTNVELMYCVSKYHDIITGHTALILLRTICIGVFSFGSSGLLTSITVDFVDKFGISKVNIEKWFMYIHGALVVIGGLGAIITHSIKASGYSRNKEKTVKLFVDNEVNMRTVGCTIVHGTGNDINLS